MRGVLVALVAVGSLVVTSSAAGAAVGCRSGRTLWRSDGVRVFSLLQIYGNPTTEGSHYRRFYVCARGARRAYPFWGSPFSRNESVSSIQLVGRRLGFVGFSEGVSNGGGKSVGWVQLPHGPVREKGIWSTEFDAEEPEPEVPAEQLRYALAEDGSIALAGEGVDREAEAEHPNVKSPEEWEVALLTYRNGHLTQPKPLLHTISPSEAPTLSSIAIDSQQVTWTNRAGSTVTVQR